MRREGVRGRRGVSEEGEGGWETGWRELMGGGMRGEGELRRVREGER